jgi:hypothetical protein
MPGRSYRLRLLIGCDNLEKGPSARRGREEAVSA